MQKTALGKGLASLLPNAAVTEKAVLATQIEKKEEPMVEQKKPQTQVNNKDYHPGISFALVGEIQANPYQPRRDFNEENLLELAQSIQENGIVQPILVRRAEKGYQLIAGERRLRAAKLAGLTQVPVVIRRSTDKESLELALIENIQRDNLNCIDEALAYDQLVQDFDLSHDQISKKVGKERASISNFLRLLKLPSEIVKDLREQKISFGHGKVILSIPDKKDQIKIRDHILKGNLSVRATEEVVSKLKEQGLKAVETISEKAEENKQIKLRLKTISNDLTRRWSTKIEIKGNEEKGKILFHYKNKQQLDQILEKIQKEIQW